MKWWSEQVEFDKNPRARSSDAKNCILKSTNCAQPLDEECITIDDRDHTSFRESSVVYCDCLIGNRGFRCVHVDRVR